MIKIVEKPLDVQIYYPVGIPTPFPAHPDRIQRAATRPIPIRIGVEDPLHARLQVHGHDRLLESDVVRELLSAAGADGGNTEVRWKWGQGPRGAYCRGQNRSNGGRIVVGTADGIDLPGRFVRVPAGQVTAGCGGQVP